MNNKKLMSIFLGFIFLLCAQGNVSAEEKKIKIESDKDKISYLIGTDIIQSMGPIKEGINLDQFMLGIRDAFEGNESQISKKEGFAIMQAFSMKMQEKQMQQMKLDMEKNDMEGESFLKENKEKEGVITTNSGLQYIVLKEGDGPVPTLDSKVTVHYKGTTIDGKEFDSSYSRGEPISFPVTGVIKGWTEVLQLMKTGSKYKVFIPSDLAYGLRGSPPKIGPNAVLIFEIELIEID